MGCTLLSPLLQLTMTMTARYIHTRLVSHIQPPPPAPTSTAPHPEPAHAAPCLHCHTPGAFTDPHTHPACSSNGAACCFYAWASPKVLRSCCCRRMQAGRHRAAPLLAHSAARPAQHLNSMSMLLSGGRPTQARRMFSNMARCLLRALTTGVPSGTSGALVR